ncbi:glycosyltransferase family 2 protein [Rhizobium sp. BR 315]|uniref:glycosyltransferase family 2 protein n=1 Tax=Rhizobium sp. BR 315 TaxID=3040014 RepID=UPI003D331877
MSHLPVSVVIPTFRDGEALRRALNSVANQTQAPGEIFVVDDAGGEPGVGAILTDFQALPLRLIELDKNIGPGGARNAGIKASQQPFIAFLDADDEWHPRKLEYQMQIMLGLASPDFSAHSKAFRARAWPEQNLGQSRPFSRWPVLLSNPASISTVIVRRDAIKFTFPDWYAGEDYAFVAANLLAGLAAVKLDLTLARAHKAPFGAGGLSGRMLAMQMGEMRTHWLLLSEGLIAIWEYTLLLPWTLLKYLRRSVIAKLQKYSLDVEN